MTAVQGVLLLLNEPEPLVQQYSIKKLLECVDLNWSLISDSLPQIESMYDLKPSPDLALLLSKIYYHLSEYEESLAFALKSNFKITDSEYSDCILLHAIDAYIQGNREEALQNLVDNVFRSCIDDKEFRHACGVALESDRKDILLLLIEKEPKLLDYLLSCSPKRDILELITKEFKKQNNYQKTVECLIMLNESSACSELITNLLQKDILMAFQLAFDIEQNGSQKFTIAVKSGLPAVPQKDDMEVDSPLTKVHEILEGKIRTGLYLEFMFRNNNTDLQIMRNTKAAFDSRSSALHSTLSVANALQNAGTTNDDFLRESTDWLYRSTNWARFTATCSLGVINKGHLLESLKLLGPYLPTEGASDSAYSEGGALFALGIIHHNHGEPILSKLVKALSSQNEVLQHGAALGIGAAAMATQQPEYYEALKNVLFNDGAVSGEACGIAMGLVMLGSGNNSAISEMLQYAHDTQHEKIIRGLALGIALCLYSLGESADSTIELLCSDKDAVIRYGGMMSVGLAYAGTASNKAIKRLLHVAVSDVNDDVRRAAVLNLGLVMFKEHHKVPQLVQLLSESYNPMVRYGSTLALGIACAGTANTEALDILMGLTKDNVDYVRQGAMIALALVTIQQNAQTCPKVNEIREIFSKVAGDKREELLARVGAGLAQGIIDAGGRNATIMMQTPSGHNLASGIVGMTLFTQFWYWFPLGHFLSLSLVPTGVIGLNEQLEVPEWQVRCDDASKFSYPPPLEKVKIEVKEKVATAVLSTTAKSKERAKKAGKEEMEIDQPEKPVEEVKKTKPEVKAEKVVSEVKNFERVVPQQVPYISLKPGSRYEPVGESVVGIVMLRDLQSGTKQTIVSSKLEEKIKLMNAVPSGSS